MKKLLPFLLLLISVSLYAQNPISDYNFTWSNGSSTMLAPNRITNDGWDDTSVTLPLGFEFKFNNIFVDSVTINSNGYVQLENAGILYIFGIDLTDRVNLGSTFTSPIEYEYDSVTNTVDPRFGDKLMRINYNGVRFKGDGDSNYVNLTIMLYENFTVEYLYGASHVNLGLWGSSQLNTTPACAIGYQVSPGIYNFMTAKGSVKTATVEAQNGLAFPQQGTPPWYPLGNFSGNRYTFEPKNVGIAELDSRQLRLYPNPASSEVTIDVTGVTGPYKLTVLNELGTEVYDATLGGLQSLDVSTLARGLYIVRIDTATGVIYKKLLLI